MRFRRATGDFRFRGTNATAFLEQHREAYDALATALKGLETEFAALTQKPEELTRIARRSFELRQELAFLFESNERNFVYWYERRNKGVFLAATPIDVSQILRERLFEKFDTVVLTSATLTVGGRFEYIRQRVGLDHTKESALPPEFDWAEQALLYMPRTIPDVRNPGFAPAAADEIVKLLELSQGRAFCLFTSYSQMNDLFERVRNRVSFPLLLQGTAPRSVLLERFKNTPGAVLVCDVELLAGRGRAGRAAFLRDCGPIAVCGAERSDRGGAGERVAGRRAQCVRGISGAAGGAGAEAGVWAADSHEDGSRRAGAARQPDRADAVW